MAAACALHGGQVALSAGQPELSVELFTVAGATQEGSAFVSYTVEAKRRFKQMEHGTKIEEGWRMRQTPETGRDGSVLLDRKTSS